MLVLITYDVNTQDSADHPSLLQNEIQSVKYVKRVQNSVLE